MTFKYSAMRIGGNWITAFLSPLAGTTIAFNLPMEDINLKIIATALISASILAGISIGYELNKHGTRNQ